MIYRVYDEDGRFVAEGVGGPQCWQPLHIHGCHFRLLIIWDGKTLCREIGTTLDAACEAAKLKVMAGNMPEGEAKEATMKRLDLWASLTKDPALRSNLDMMLNEAMTECEEALYALQYRGIDNHMSIDNMDHDRAEWATELWLPRIMSQNSAWAIMRAVNQYMQCKTIATWSQEMLGEASEMYAAKADQQMTILRSVVKHRNAGTVERREGWI